MRGRTTSVAAAIAIIVGVGVVRIPLVRPALNPVERCLASSAIAKILVLRVHNPGACLSDAFTEAVDFLLHPAKCTAIHIDNSCAQFGADGCWNLDNLLILASYTSCGRNQIV